MYLTLDAIEPTLAVIDRRSAPGSRLVIAYHAPALMRHLVGFVVRRLGEPFRSAFTAAQRRALLERHRFAITRDADLPTFAAPLSAQLARDTRVTRHLRIAVADRP